MVILPWQVIGSKRQLRLSGSSELQSLVSHKLTMHIMANNLDRYCSKSANVLVLYKRYGCSVFTWHHLLTPFFETKIGHITCDNASNNFTIMEEFSAWLKALTGKRYKWHKQKVKWALIVCLIYVLSYSTSPCSCLAHIINLATQALIAMYSKSPHFDPKNPEAHIPTSHNEVGLVRAIVVKVQCGIFYWCVIGYNLLFRNVLLQNANKSDIWLKSKISSNHFNSFLTWRCIGHQRT